MFAAGRILLDVLIYRLRRLEMANLMATGTLLVALKLPWAESALRFSFACVLNLLAYLINDHFDLERDLATGRAPPKTQFLQQHQQASMATQIGLTLLLAGLSYGLQRPALGLSLGAGLGLCWAYSRWLKHMALLDILSMAPCGAAMALCAVPLDSGPGWLLLGQLGIFSMCFESIQVLRDRTQDAASQVRTSAVVWGPRATLWLTRGAILLAAGYASLWLQRWLGLALLGALCLPINAWSDSPQFARYWNQVRLIFGLTWLGLLAAFIISGKFSGWLTAY